MQRSTFSVHVAVWTVNETDIFLHCNQKTFSNRNLGHFLKASKLWALILYLTISNFSNGKITSIWIVTKILTPNSLFPYCLFMYYNKYIFQRKTDTWNWKYVLERFSTSRGLQYKTQKQRTIFFRSNWNHRTRHLFIWKDWTLTACTASSRSFSCSSWGDCCVVGYNIGTRENNMPIFTQSTRSSSYCIFCWINQQNPTLMQYYITSEF